MKKISILLSSAIIAFTSCKKDGNGGGNNHETGIFSSDSVTMFGGSAKTWVNVSNGMPQQLAISIKDAAMNSLPTDATEELETEIPLSTHASSTVFDHVAVDWNPHGHEPDGIYSFPHFDFHFYMIPTAEQENIPAYEDDSTGFLHYPAEKYMPANYIPIPGGVPMMGSHWIDVTSSEWNGQPFTQTFIYGSYDGSVIFYEPMITKAFLDATTIFTRDIPQPSNVQKTGWYPTKLKVSKHDGVTEIILDGFIYREKQ